MDFFLAFIPLFIAVDPIGILPNFMGLTRHSAGEERKKIIIQSVVTALIVSIIFLVSGKHLLKYLGISVSDFMIAGGILLFIFSISDLIGNDQISFKHQDLETLGAVPIGVPLIAGPGLFTTMFVVEAQHGMLFTLISVVSIILITGVTFWFSGLIHKLLGNAGSKALSKIASLLLAAIAVMFIRRGLTMIIGELL